MKTKMVTKPVNEQAKKDLTALAGIKTDVLRAANMLFENTVGKRRLPFDVEMSEFAEQHGIELEQLETALTAIAKIRGYLRTTTDALEDVADDLVDLGFFKQRADVIDRYTQFDARTLDLMFMHGSTHMRASLSGFPIVTHVQSRVVSVSEFENGPRQNTPIEDYKPRPMPNVPILELIFTVSQFNEESKSMLVFDTERINNLINLLQVARKQMEAVTER